MRDRDRRFIDAVTVNLEAGMPEREAATAAYRTAFMSTGWEGKPWKDDVVERAALNKMEKSVIREALAAYLTEKTGMTPGEMLTIRVEMARGEKTETVVVRRGKDRPDEMVQKPISAALQLKALEGLEKLVFVPPTQHVKVDQTSTLSAVFMSDLGQGVPAMAAREIDVTPALLPVALGAEENDDAE